MNTDGKKESTRISRIIANREESKTSRVNSRNSRQGFVGHPCSSVFIRGLIFFPLVWLRFRLRPPDETQRGFASCLLHEYPPRRDVGGDLRITQELYPQGQGSGVSKTTVRHRLAPGQSRRA